MIFVDTSALYALVDEGDASHAEASALFPALLQSGVELFTTNYVAVEACALLQRRLGLLAAEDLVTNLLPLLKVVWMDEEAHDLAVRTLLSTRRRKVSLVDCSSFVVMRMKGCSRAFAFDDHFAQEGFELLKP